MKRVAFWGIALAVLLAWATIGRTVDQPAKPKVPANWKFSLPAGDAQAGKEAFRKMNCYSCHKVPGSDLPRERTSGGVGPDLVASYSKLPREFLAESIIDSHKYISGTLEKYQGQDKVSSKMGDYSSIMSVRELIDIVEFLKHLDGKQ
jgi:cytochrome c2